MVDAPPPLLPVALIGAAAGIVSAAALWAYAVFSPRCQFWAPVIRSLPQREAVVLTFDGGPHAEVTPRILDILAREHVPATFFLVGRQAAAGPELVRRIHASGHALGNHTFDGARFRLRRPRGYWAAQLGETQKVIGALSGMSPLLFRPPQGYKTRALAAAARELRLPIIGWSVRAPAGLAAERLAARVVKQTTGHDIVALRGDDPATAEALPAIIARIREKKLQIVPLVDVLVAASDDVQRVAARTRSRAAES